MKSSAAKTKFGNGDSERPGVPARPGLGRVLRLEVAPSEPSEPLPPAEATDGTASRSAIPTATRSPHLGSEPTQADGWYDLGCELESRASDLAMVAYERALALEPAHADAHTNLGRLLHEQGRVREALTHYRRAVALAPADATAHFNLGVALQDVRDFGGSALAYEAALALDPTLADAHSNLALVRERLGDRAAAIRHFAEAKRHSG